MHETERTIFFAVITEAVIFVLLLSLFIITIYRYHRKKLLDQRISSQITINLIELERQRIGADLHDELGSLLALLKLNLQGVEISNADEKLALRSEIKLIDTIYNKIREVSNDLMPQILNIKGLRIALEQLADHVREASSISVMLNFDEDLFIANKEQQIHVYRIVQELLNNCVKHAKATEIEITIRKNNTKIELVVSDNGAGFDTSSLKEADSSGIGFKNILTRASSLGGIPYVFSSKETGTSFQLEFTLLT